MQWIGLIPNARPAVAGATLLVLSACASSDPGLSLEGQRTVFFNPYAPIELENGPVGPELCEGCARGAWIDGVFYPGRGGFAFTPDGTRVRLTRRERRLARERFRQIENQIAQNQRVEQFNTQNDARNRPVPEPSAPPIARQAERPAASSQTRSTAHRPAAKQSEHQ